MATKSRTGEEIDAELEAARARPIAQAEYLSAMASTIKSGADRALAKLRIQAAGTTEVGDVALWQLPAGLNPVESVHELRDTLCLIISTNIESFLQVVGGACGADGLTIAERTKRIAALERERHEYYAAIETALVRAEGFNFLLRPPGMPAEDFLNPSATSQNFDVAKLAKARRFMIGLGRNISDVNASIGDARAEIVKLQAWMTNAIDTQQRERAEAKIKNLREAEAMLQTDIVEIRRQWDLVSGLVSRCERFLEEHGIKVG